MGNAVRGYKGAANDSPSSSLFAKAMRAHFSAQQVVDQMFSDVQEQQENNDLEEEEVSEEEDGEESDQEEIPQTERDTFLSKNSKITWSLSPYDNHGCTKCQTK